MNASLVLVREDGKQQEVPLKRQAIVGRQTDCTIRIPDSGISRHHCELTLGDGKVMLRDLGSSNGTYVNRVKVTQAELGAGDLISIGNLVFVVKIDGSPAVIDAEEAWDEGAVPIASAATKPAAAKPAAPAAPAKQGTAAQPAKRPLVDPGDSSVADFDFLDEDEDIKKQPKL
ncbi:MAG TPA: FHA domain-containing protein [Phycisphaerales bacterium]|nr:FHA domain-containing protein [Phycisphaerales bacterium]